MRSYLIRRVLLIIPTFIVVSMIIFLILRLIPGNVIDTIAAQYIYLSNLDKTAIEKALGLNVPLYIQYFRWMGQIFLHGNFGKSFVTNLPVTTDIKARWPVTFELGIMALILAQLIALPVGIYSAMRQDTVGDYCRIANRGSRLLGCDAGNCFPFNMVALHSFDYADLLWKRPAGELKNVHHTGDSPGYAVVRNDHENDAHHDAGSFTAGLHPDCLGEGTDRKSRCDEACVEECVHPGYHHHRVADTAAGRRRSYH